MSIQESEQVFDPTLRPHHPEVAADVHAPLAPVDAAWFGGRVVQYCAADTDFGREPAAEILDATPPIESTVDEFDHAVETTLPDLPANDPAVEDRAPAPIPPHRNSSEEVERLVAKHWGLAVHIARRYSKSSSDSDDVEAVALVGLFNAALRFNPALGFSFGAFAGTTIEGEIRRYFRDNTWAVRVPRAAKEDMLRLRQYNDERASLTGVNPSAAETKERFGWDDEHYENAVRALNVRRVRSYDEPRPGDGEMGTDQPDRGIHLEDTRAGAFPDQVDNSVVLAEALEHLAQVDPRYVTILERRFYDHRSQTDIAKELGCSQVLVSRLQRRALEILREFMGGQDPETV